MHVRLVAAALGLTAWGRVGFDGGASGDAPGGDGPGSDIAVACVHVFCDDLEDPAFGAWTGSNVDGGGTAVRDAAFGRTGGSLTATSPVGSSEADRWVDAFPTQPVADQWVRVMVFAPSGQTLDLEPLGIRDGARTQEYVFSLYDSDVDIHAHGIAGDFIVQGAMPPRDRWVCYELHVRYSTGDGMVELYQDGARVATHTGTTTAAPNTVLRRVAVGIVSKPTSLAEHVWIDDVAADTTRIGCP